MTATGTLSSGGSPLEGKFDQASVIALLSRLNRAAADASGPGVKVDVPRRHIRLVVKVAPGFIFVGADQISRGLNIVL